MNIVPQNMASAGEIMESVIIKGDLSKLTPQERSDYYISVCKSIGLNPLTQPFAYIKLSGKDVLYAKRDCADQLRKINRISIEIVSQSITDGLLTIHVRAKDASGRIDEDFGVVAIGTLKGEAAANAFLKAVTKAKRRVTLSISGLGFLDETEVDDIPQARRSEHAPPALEQIAPPTHDSDGVVYDDYIAPAQLEFLIAMCDEVGADKERFCRFFKIDGIPMLPASRYAEAVSMLETKRDRQ